MNDLNRVSGGPALPLSQPGNLSADVADRLQQARLDPAQTLQEIATLAGTLKTLNAPASSGGNTITNANGAPQLDGVTVNFSAEDMAAMLLVLQSKTQEAQLSTAKEGLNTNKKKLEDQNQRSMDKINDWIKKCEDQSAKEKANSILNWFQKIFTAIAAAFAVVAAAVATVSTGGLAAPLLALAVLSLASSVVSIASEVDKANGGEGFDHVSEWMDPGTLIGKGVGELAKAVGADDQTAAILSAVYAVAATIAIMAVSVMLTGGASASSQIGQMQKTILTAARVGQAVAGVVGGATQVAKGGVDIAIAHDQRDATLIQADKKKIDAIIAKLQKQMEEDREEIKKVLDEMMEGMNIVSKMINSAGESRAQISSNLSGKTQTI
ncbi:type III secretion system translocon subunit SctE [Acidovorax sp.]|uniref:type III secretion system translocon subunit SctE n=1 Tax=Acidovorax sp. TaxID=1872122 RepID=UPI002617ABA8|nr:type III secretion system translocon subunit SctE [Acidovorax sp.]